MRGHRSSDSYCVKNGSQMIHTIYDDPVYKTVPAGRLCLQIQYILKGFHDMGFF